MKTDFLGQELKKGSLVFASKRGHHDGMRWGKVTGFHHDAVKVTFIKGKKTEFKNAEELVVMGESQHQSLNIKLLKA